MYSQNYLTNTKFPAKINRQTVSIVSVTAGMTKENEYCNEV